ncbi:hypothetical protein [Bradyrhizobium sp. CSS354]|uniref:hypothetical protein n=1 Tax=Bradyrhizobium sp. CSS354 TaxID=2699172 RepID=UPI0023AFE34B|nr:hypothetical protein [Bradyrhizobium sp. CSS354]
MEGDHIRRLGCLAKLFRDLIPLPLQFMHARANNVEWRSAFCDGIYQPIQFAADLAHPALCVAAVSHGQLLQTLTLFVVRFHESCNRRRIGEIFAQPA